MRTKRSANSKSGRKTNGRSGRRKRAGSGLRGFNKKLSAALSGLRGHFGAGRESLRFILPFATAVILFILLFSGVRKVLRHAGKDTTPPVITLTRVPDYYVAEGQEYEEEGFSARDDRDGDLTGRVERFTSGNVICYKVADNAGNATIEYRTVPVRRESGARSGAESDDGLTGSGLQYVSGLKNKEPGYVPEKKVIYLTFDDGPGEHTERLLEILDHYKVRVTFFVTGAFPYYADLIKKEYEAGHSIGVHSYSHDFEKIYSDDKAFWKDFEEMEKVIEKQTGHRTNLMRFAGGSSNTLSASYTKGIMTLLTGEAEKKGYHYFDWNVSSGDGSSYISGQDVINNIISQVQNNDHSVVLCHDTKDATVNNIEYVIAWALENGYTFLPLNETSETAHHAVLN